MLWHVDPLLGNNRKIRTCIRCRKLDRLTWPYINQYINLEVDSASNRNEYQESLKIKEPGGTVRLARRADNLAAIY
jgi:hypothetical protein